jgi:two-component system, chemotaxis family, sensor kinase CheA
VSLDPARYAELFLTESRENLSAINHALLELEQTGGAEPVEALFRAVHTVKGMSATMGYSAVAELAHEMETLLDGVRKGVSHVSPEVMDVLFQSADGLEHAIERAVAGKKVSPEVASLVERIRALVRSTPDVTEGGDSPIVAPEGQGIAVRVRLQPDTPLRGVRAYMILQKVKQLGNVTAVEPSLDALQEERFEHEFAFRLVTESSSAQIEDAIRSGGFVADVAVGRATPNAAISAIPTPRSTRRISRATRATPRLTAAVPAQPEAAAPRAARHIRIDLRRLDNLMNLVGELVIARGRLVQLSQNLGNLISQLQDEIMTSRMVPVWQVFDRFPRMVRDAARSLGKQVDFQVEGKEIELDRSMLDEIGDPIVHLLRNAVDHGIESPEKRQAAGKSAIGRLRLSALRDRSSVVIKVSDDGRGIDREKVLRRAKELGLVEATRAELTDDELVRFISRSGFSTAEKVTDISGRGVGIDAVQARVRALGGSLDVRTTPGSGTTITARLPVTLAIVRALLARVKDETYALPMTHVNETVDLETARQRTVRGKEVLVLRDEVVPLIHLRDRVGLPRVDSRSQVVVVEMLDRRAGVVVDELTGQQEIVVKQFDAVRDGLSLFSGATILGDGEPALILDVGSLI